MMEVRKILLYLFKKYNGDWDKIYQEIADKHLYEEDVIEKCYRDSVDNMEMFITFVDEIYPESLRQIFKPPFVLFYSGDISLLSNVNRQSFIFLYGNNVYNIPEEKIAKFDDDGKLDLGGKLKLWENVENVSRFRLPTAFSDTVVLCNRYSIEKGNKTKFNKILLPSFFSKNCNIFVSPTVGPSYNNNLINEGATLIDSLDVLKEANIL